MLSYGPLASPSSSPSFDARLIPSRLAECGGSLARSSLPFAFTSLSSFGSVRQCTTAGRTRLAPSVPFQSKSPFVNLSVRSSPIFFAAPVANPPHSGRPRRSVPHFVTSSTYPRYPGQASPQASLLHLFHIEFVSWCFYPSHKLAHDFILSVVTTIVSLVHASYIITRGGIPEVISALVEDCMSLTVANFPVVLGATIRHFSSAPSDDDDEPSLTWKFRVPTQPDSATVTGQLSTGFRPRGAVNTTTTIDVTNTTIDLTKKSGIPAFEVGSEERLFGASGAEKKTEGELVMDGNSPTTAVTTAVHREDRGVLRIDVLPYFRETPPSPLLPPTPATGEL